MDEELQYKITKWAGEDNYECLKCQFATLEKLKIIKHIQIGNHVWSFPKEEKEAE